MLQKPKREAELPSYSAAFLLRDGGSPYKHLPSTKSSFLSRELVMKIGDMGWRKKCFLLLSLIFKGRLYLAMKTNPKTLTNAFSDGDIERSPSAILLLFDHGERNKNVSVGHGF